MVFLNAPGGSVTTADSLTPPAQRSRLNFVHKISVFTPRRRPFAFEHLVPFRLHIDIIDPDHRFLMFHAEVLQIDHVAILAKEFAGHRFRNGDGES